MHTYIPRSPQTCLKSLPIFMYTRTQTHACIYTHLERHTNNPIFMYTYIQTRAYIHTHTHLERHTNNFVAFCVQGWSTGIAWVNSCVDLNAYCVCMHVCMCECRFHWSCPSSQLRRFERILCMYACMYVCMYVSLELPEFTAASIWTHNVYVCMCTSTLGNTPVCMHVCACAHIYLHVLIYSHICSSLDVHIHARDTSPVCICVCMYVCIYISYTHTYFICVRVYLHKLKPECAYSCTSTRDTTPAVTHKLSPPVGNPCECVCACVCMYMYVFI